MSNLMRNGAGLAALVTIVALVAAGGQMAAQAPPAAASGSSASSASGFSIETEMLTYRALESNSEAIACDVAAYLNGTTATFAPRNSGSNCTVKIGSSKALVVVLPFDKTQLVDFQLWRADMETMARLRRKASTYCSGAEPTRAGTVTSAAGSLLSMTPAGPPLALAQSVFGLLASQESSSAVGGTIQDQTLIDNVGRELLALRMQVLMPTVYQPHALSSLNENTSPYLAFRGQILTALGCLSSLPASDDAKGKDIQQTIAEINGFLAASGDTATVETKVTVPAGSSGKQAAAPLPGSSSLGTQGSPTAAIATHMSAVLSADGLAQQLGFDPRTGELRAGSPTQHILLLKALESGGSVTKNSNVLGTKMAYSGGSVGTYALFGANGNLECSGNVYDYAGPLRSKDFDNTLRGLQPDPAKQVIFQRGGCVAPAPAQASPGSDEVK
jgi:hypothetical protein